MATVDGPLLATQLPTGVGSIGSRVEPQKLQWLRPTSKDTPIEEIRRRLKDDGYVFVKGLIPREDILDIREWYFTQFAGTNLLEPGTRPRDGIFRANADPYSFLSIGGGLPADDRDTQILIDAHKDPTYRQFLDHPSLRTFVRELMGWKRETLLQRTMLRHNVPNGESTAVHYDKLFLRASPSFFLTGWVPLGDLSVTGGGLIYLKDAVPLGRAIEEDFARRAVDMTPEERQSAFNANMMRNGMLSMSPKDFEEDFVPNRRLKPEDFVGGGVNGTHTWLVTAYEAGDVVFHDPFSIHASSRNEDPQRRIRLSTDLRFYDAEGDIDGRWMKFWEPDDGL